MTNSQQPQQGDQNTRRRYWRFAAAGVAVVFLAGLVVLFYTVDVCDNQLAQNSSTVKVCRHLQVTDPPAAVVGLVAIALLGAVFGEISAFGVTVKQKVAQLEQQTTTLYWRTSKLGVEVQQVAADAERARENSEDLYETLSPPREPVEPEAKTPFEYDELSDLVARYNEIRRTMPSGEERTREMDKVFSQMISRLESVGNFDVSQALRSSDRGERLTAYAYLVSRPAPHHLADLVKTLVKEDKPYGEYRAAVAAARLADIYPNELTTELCQLLQERLEQLPAGTDRAFELRRILLHCR